MYYRNCYFTDLHPSEIQQQYNVQCPCGMFNGRVGVNMMHFLNVFTTVIISTLEVKYNEIMLYFVKNNNMIK